MNALVWTKPRILPPKGLLIAVVAQLPIMIAGFPLRPSALSMAAGALLLAAGATLNIWAERLFHWQLPAFFY
jgi:hypothetical protein